MGIAGRAESRKGLGRRRAAESRVPAGSRIGRPQSSGNEYPPRIGLADDSARQSLWRAKSFRYGGVTCGCWVPRSYPPLRHLLLQHAYVGYGIDLFFLRSHVSHRTDGFSTLHCTSPQRITSWYSLMPDSRRAANIVTGIPRPAASTSTACSRIFETLPRTPLLFFTRALTIPPDAIRPRNNGQR